MQETRSSRSWLTACCLVAVTVDRVAGSAGCVAGGWQFGAWGTQVFISTTAADAVTVVVNPADVNNTGRFFPGRFTSASGHYNQAGDVSLSLTFSNGTTLCTEAINTACTILRWPNGASWYKLPTFPHVKKVHIVQSCHLDIGFAGTSVDIINKYIGPGEWEEKSGVAPASLHSRLGGMRACVCVCVCVCVCRWGCGDA
jgi:hypothetical protein